MAAIGELEDAAPLATVTRRAQFLATGLFGAGLVCWIAANWQDVSRLAKLGLAGAVFVVFALATLAPRWRAASALGALVALGALLALVGQLYPTGADAWLLFAAWAGLGLPFALAARADACWTLWAGVLGLALAMWRMQEAPGVALADWAPPSALAVLVAAAFGPYVATTRAWLGSTRWAFRLAAAVAIGLIFSAGLQAAVDDPRAPAAAAFVAIPALGAIFAALLRLRPLEAGPAALAALGCDALIVVVLWRVMTIGHADPVGAMLAVALVAAGLAGLAVVLLRAAARAGARRDERASAAPLPEQSEPPTVAHAFALAALSFVGAVLAMIPAAAFFALAVGLRGLEGPVGMIVGAAGLACGVAALRGGSAFGVCQMIGAILSMLGLALIAFAAPGWGFRAAPPTMAALSVLAAVCAALVGGRWPRAFFAAIAMGFALAAATYPAFRLGLTGVALVAAPALGRLAAATSAPSLRSAFSGATAIALAALIGAAWLQQSQAATGVLALKAGADPAALLSAALGVAGLLAALLRAPEGRAPVARLLALALALVLPFAPMTGLAIFIAAAMRLAGATALTYAAAFAALAQFAASAYALDWTLATKGLAFMAVGAGLGALLLAFAPRHAAATHARAAAPIGRAAPAFALLGLIGVAFAVTPGVREAEAAIAAGREVLLPLRPRDPRSLMQGDYIAIEVDASGLPAPETAPGPTLARARVDANGVARFVGLAGADPAGEDALIAVRPRRAAGRWMSDAATRWFVGSDAYFFPEGEGAAYQGARYGVFRLAPSGRAVLVGLADEKRRRLP